VIGNGYQCDNCALKVVEEHNFMLRTHSDRSLPPGWYQLTGPWAAAGEITIAARQFCSIDCTVKAFTA
jgi:hypothetical protein